MPTMLLPTVTVSAAAIALQIALMCARRRRPAEDADGRKASGPDPQQAAEQQAQRQFQAMRLRAVQIMMRILWGSVFALTLAVSLMQSVQRGAAHFVHKEGRPATVSTFNILLAMLGLLMTFALSTRRVGRWLRRSSWCKDRQVVDLMQSLLMAVFAVQGVYAVQGIGGAQTGAFRDSINSVRLVVCMVCMSPTATGFWAVVNVGTYVTAMKFAEREELFAVALAETISGSVACLSALIAGRMATSLARSEVAARTSQKEVAAVKSLLNTTCDVVVQLDGELRVAGAHPALAALLFCNESSLVLQRSDGAEHLAGAEFSKFLATDTDQEVFTTHMTSPPARSIGSIGSEIGTETETGTGLADAFQVSLRDKLGNEIQVQIFHIPFEVGDGDIHHLIGLTESGERKDWGQAAGAHFGEPRGEKATGEDQVPGPYVPPEISMALYYRQAAVRKTSARLAAARKRDRTRMEREPPRGTPPQTDAAVSGAVPELQATIGRVATAASLASEADSVLSFEESAAQNFDHINQRYIRPDLRPTSPLAKEFCLIRTMMQWNYHVGGACCSFHAGTRLLMASSKKMCKEGCFEMLSLGVHPVQCGTCGLLLEGLPSGQTVCIYCQHVAESKMAL